nr:MAG TPA: hypothetical protein [Caudoviricetes sp.]DAM14555.1 MAG TPA: hypothetical protein [Caudoviricetes sp.]
MIFLFLYNMLFHPIFTVENRMQYHYSIFLQILISFSTPQ